jgi:RimJ/RimL family protein N-acetyltransferase
MDSAQLPTINTSRLSLRWIRAEDVDDFYAVYSNPQVMRYWSTPPLPDKDAASKLINEIHENVKRDDILKWGIALRSSDKLIGSVTLFHLDFIHRRAEIGYAQGRAYWGQGYMQEALKAVLNHAFEVLNLHRIEADVDPRNAASVRTLERLGFQREGYLRERWQVNGEIQDAYYYGLLRSDWDKNSSNSTSSQSTSTQIGSTCTISNLTVPIAAAIAINPPDLEFPSVRSHLLKQVPVQSLLYLKTNSDVVLKQYEPITREEKYHGIVRQNVRRRRLRS